jgi:GTPase-activating protein BEM2
VKSWFRVLPEPVFPPSSYHDVMDAMSKFVLCYVINLGRSFLILSRFFFFGVELENLDKRLLNIRRVVQGLPQANFDILRRVSEHLDKFVVALFNSRFIN